MSKRGCLTKADLSPHDLAEVEQFERYLRLASEKRAAGKPHNEAARLAHAEIYGEVVFEASPTPAPPGKP